MRPLRCGRRDQASVGSEACEALDGLPLGRRAAGRRASRGVEAMPEACALSLPRERAMPETCPFALGAGTQRELASYRPRGQDLATCAPGAGLCVWVLLCAGPGICAARAGQEACPRHNQRADPSRPALWACPFAAGRIFSADYSALVGRGTSARSRPLCRVGSARAGMLPGRRACDLMLPGRRACDLCLVTERARWREAYECDTEVQQSVASLEQGPSREPRA